MRGERDILFYFLEEFEFPTSHIADVARMNISPRNSSRNVLKYDQYFIFCPSFSLKEYKKIKMHSNFYDCISLLNFIG